MKFKRIFLLVLDSLGVGEAIDCDKYNDRGCNTLGHLNELGLFIPNLNKLGLTNTLTLSNNEADAYYTIARPKNKGKDSISGHYEIVCLEKNYEGDFINQTFPRELLEKIAYKIQLPIIGNIECDAETIINRLAERQRETKSLILFTTGDSNLEVAADESVIPFEKLEEYAKSIKEIIEESGYKINSIIARPFIKNKDKYILQSDTKRYVNSPKSRSILDELKDNNLQVISIGKINDLFNGQGITKVIKAHTNQEVTNKLLDLMEKNFEGLCFANFPDFDTLYGHSRNKIGYKNALEEFDVEIPLIINKLNIDDLLIITADHGNDPTMEGTSHTRENVPVIIYSRKFIESGQLDILDSFSDIGATIIDNFKLQKPWFGTSFFDKLR